MDNFFIVLRESGIVVAWTSAAFAMTAATSCCNGIGPASKAVELTLACQVVTLCVYMPS